MVDGDCGGSGAGGGGGTGVWPYAVRLLRVGGWVAVVQRGSDSADVLIVIVATVVVYVL